MASQRVVTSQVFKGPGLWYEESYLIPHEPLRWDLDEASRLLDEKYFDGTAAWKARKRGVACEETRPELFWQCS